MGLPLNTSGKTRSKGNRPGDPPAQGVAADPRRAPTRAPGRRRSFSQRNLALETDGPLGTLLGEALQVPESGGYTGTHAFHPYPGRFHPQLPRTLLAAFARPGHTVLDPFMGGGTTLVEGLLQGLTLWGNDLNPVALRVARERTRPRSPAESQRLQRAVQGIATAVEALRREKQPPRVIHPRQGSLSRYYAPHLLAELMQWYRLIDAAPGADVRETLQTVLSAGAVKFSNIESDSTAEPGTSPRYGKGAVTRFLVAKTRELAQAQTTLAERIPTGTPPPVLMQEDTRLLPSLGWGVCDLVLTSPPYPGTYDYHAQHRLRLDWLGLDDSAFEEGEIGARRHGATEGAAGATGAAPTAGAPGTEPREGWSESLRAVLGTLARVLRPGGSLLLVMGDWTADGHPVDAAAMLGRTAGARDWTLSSRASVRRDAHSRTEARAYSKRGKWEHLLHFTRPAVEPGSLAEPRQRRQRSKGGRIRTL